jgi:hypothetical protein
MVAKLLSLPVLAACGFVIAAAVAGGGPFADTPMPSSPAGTPSPAPTTTEESTPAPTTPAPTTPAPTTPEPTTPQPTSPQPTTDVTTTAPIPPVVPLELTGLFITPKRFGTADGTTVQFRLSKAATVTFIVKSVLEGRERSGRCVVTGAAGKSGPRCIRYDYAGRLAIEGAEGVNRIAFTGRLANGALSAGRYRLTAIATSVPEIVSAGPVRFRIT